MIQLYIDRKAGLGKQRIDKKSERVNLQYNVQLLKMVYGAT